MAMAIHPGFTFRPKAVGAHPWVVLSPPKNGAVSVLVVNWTTFRNTCVDDVCFLDVGDHKLIEHRSTIAYSRAKIWDSAKIAFAIEQSALNVLDPVSPNLLARIIAGAKISRELSAEYKAYL